MPQTQAGSSNCSLSRRIGNGELTVDLKRGRHLAVVQLALDQVGLNATLGQGFCCAGTSGAAADDCCPEGPVQLCAVTDGKHLVGRTTHMLRQQNIICNQSIPRFQGCSSNLVI